MAGVSGPILFLVPARGGSARIPGKNLRTVGGIPLVGRAARAAVAASSRVPGGPHRVVCSTDDADIAAAARAWGAEVLDRPAELATATATSVDVALHALGALAGGSDASPFRAVVLVQPTSPLTDPDDLVAAVARFDAGGGRSVASVAASHPADWHVTRDAGPAGGGGPIRRVEAEDAAEVLSGAVYVVAPDELRATRRFVGPGTIGLPIPPERSVDVDEPHDLVVAEAFAAAAAQAGAMATGPAAAAGESASPGSRGRADRRAGPRTIGVLTTGRQDWGILHSTAAAIRAHPDLRLRLLVGGMHLSARHGSSVDEVRADGFEPDALLDWLGDSRVDPPADTQAGAALAAVGAELRANPVAALVLVGDRFETAAAALAATVCRVPIVHLHGGEQTLGAFDDALRHAITKLAHLHLVSHEEHAARVIAMGEDPATVHVVGAPGLDAIARTDLPDRAALAADLGIDLRAPVVVVTVHPATLDADPAAAAMAVAAAMDRVPATYVVTLPNVDPGAAAVRDALTSAASGPGRVAVAALGERRYWGLIRLADAMLGNSSSGVAEAPSIGLPVVNVGDRQAGRHRVGPVEDVPADADLVAGALRRVLAPGYRDSMTRPAHRLADGRAGERVAHIIAAWQPSIPPRKRPIPVRT
jgi:UDP-hydrolysing UDP-N-acetyl-D-glucosamine 2-epimerase